MERASGIRLLLCLCAGALLLGIALCFPFFSFFPLYWGAGLVGVFFFSFVGCGRFRRRAVPNIYFISGFAYSMLFVWSVVMFTGIEKLEGYECTWSLQMGRIEVDLSPVSGFGRSQVSSDELLERLRKNQPAKIHVEVPVTRDFGRVRARGAIKSVDGIPVRELDVIR